MGRLGFTSSRADSDVWFRLSTRSTGEVYNEYVLLYVDDVLVILEQGANYVRYLGLVIKLLHPLSVLQAIVFVMSSCIT